VNGLKLFVCRLFSKMARRLMENKQQLKGKKEGPKKGKKKGA
jgi:hypothetical protein